MATPIQSYAGHATLASKSMPTIEPPGCISGSAAIASDFSENADTCNAVADVGPRRMQEVAAERGRRAEGDAVHHAVEPVNVRRDPLGERAEVLFVW